MKLQFDFAAQAGKHFGRILSLDDQVVAMTDPIDVWIPRAGLTLVDGRISEWIGRRNGRILGQSNAARRPIPENGLLRFSSAALAGTTQLDLTGAAIGQRSALTIAAHARIHPESLGVDNQYLWGSSATGGILRLAYRYTNGSRYLRLQVRDATTNLDVPLPADWSGVVGAVAVLTPGTPGPTLSLHLTTGESRSVALQAPIEVPTFSAGGGNAGAAGSLAGYGGNFGIWSRAVSDAERARLLRWAI
ncbi:hypothetical protein TW83_00305 [Paracoccus sp. S4493]|uniref:hypothetical protein n=1 Tax=Paracoccus sp. S4493 TaxID=579490 RepID=UPI0005FA7C9C|nr:hypothetical protein [Paracoccus sp. S4493]KJZ33016.1 hypothetical protein TW83_00305 [Paracoccus sp. S4493]